MERLSINSIVKKYSAAYEIEQGEISTDLSKEEIEKLQKAYPNAVVEVKNYEDEE